MSKMKPLKGICWRVRWLMFRERVLKFFFPSTIESIRSIAYVDGMVDEKNSYRKIIFESDTKKSKEKAIEILNLFEELLDEHHIDIPDPLRNGEEGEAHLYGEAYYKLEDEIFGIIQK